MEGVVKPTLFDRSGRPVNIPDEEVPQALLSGQVGFKSGTEIPVINPQGEAVLIPADKAREAFAGNYKYDPVSQQEQRIREETYGGAMGQVGAAAAGALRGGTLGLSDVAMVETGLVDPEALKALKDIHPATSMGFEIGATVLPSLLTGGTSLAASIAAKSAPALAAKLGAKAGATFLEKNLVKNVIAKNAAAKAIEFGTEGAIYGLGQSISESALGDHDLVSEKTLQNIGFSAAISGGLGALVGSYVGSKAGQLADDAEDLIKAQQLGKETKPELEDILKTFSKEEKSEKTVAESIVNKMTDIKSEKQMIDDQIETVITQTTKDAEKRVAESGLTASEKLSFLSELKKEKPHADKIRQAAAEIGAPVLPSQVSASKFVQDAESALSMSPTIAGVHTAQTIKQGFDAVETTIKNTLGKVEKMPSYDVGDLLKNKIMSKIDDIYAPLKAAYKERNELGKTINLADEARLKLYDKLTKKSQSFGAVGSPGSKLIESYADRALAQNNIEQFDNLIVEINDHMRMARRQSDFHTIGALSLVKDVLDDFQIRQIVAQGKKIEKLGLPGAESISKDIVFDHKLLTKQYREFKDIINTLASDSRLGKKDFSYSNFENALEAIPNEKVLDKFFVAKNADALQRLKSKFPDVFEILVNQKKAQILDQNTVDQFPDIKKILSHIYDESKMSSKVRSMLFSSEELKKLDASKTWVEALPRNINPSGTAKTEAFMEFMKGGILKAGYENFKSGVIRKLINNFATPAERSKAETIIKIDQKVRRSSESLSKKISEIITNTDSKASSSVTEKSVTSQIKTPDQLKEMAKKINQMANDPDYFSNILQKTTGGLETFVPNVASAMQRAMIKNVSFLATKVPPIEIDGVFGQKNEPSKADVYKFGRYYEIVENPAVCLDQVSAGTLVPETIETLVNCYPKLYEEMKTNMLMELFAQKNTSKIPFKKRMVISMFLQMPLDKALMPTAVLANQTAFATDKSEQAQAAGPIKPTMGGLKEVTVADRTKLGGRWSDR